MDNIKYKICKDFNISFNEFEFIKIILMGVEGYNNIVKKYFELDLSVRGKPKIIIESLQEKHIIAKNLKMTSDHLDINKITINNKIKKAFNINPFKFGKELYEAYPIQTKINGSFVRLRSVGKHFDSLEEFYRFYTKSINFDENKHKEIIDLINWSKKYDLINCSLANFVINNTWEDLKFQKKQNYILFEDSDDNVQDFINSILDQEL